MNLTAGATKNADAVSPPTIFVVRKGKRERISGERDVINKRDGCVLKG